MSKPLIKKLLKESIETVVEERRKNYPSYITDAVRFAKNYLGIKGKIKVILTNNRSKITTTALYDLTNNEIWIYIKDRALCDILRSIFHEIVHFKQHEDGILTNPLEQGKDGTNEENEANNIAGILVRKWGKLYPIIYEL